MRRILVVLVLSVGGCGKQAPVAHAPPPLPTLYGDINDPVARVKFYAFVKYADQLRALGIRVRDTVSTAREVRSAVEGIKRISKAAPGGRACTEAELLQFSLDHHATTYEETWYRFHDTANAIAERINTAVTSYPDTHIEQRLATLRSVEQDIEREQLAIRSLLLRYSSCLHLPPLLPQDLSLR